MIGCGYLPPVSALWAGLCRRETSTSRYRFACAPVFAGVLEIGIDNQESTIVYDDRHCGAPANSQQKAPRIVRIPMF